MSMQTKPKYRIVSDGSLHNTRITEIETGREIVASRFTIQGNPYTDELVVTLEFPPGSFEFDLKSR